MRLYGCGVPVVLVLLGPRDRVRTARRHPLEGEGVREALDAAGLRLLGLGVRLAGLGDRLRSHPILDPREREEVAELGGVDHELRPEARELDRRSRSSVVTLAIASPETTTATGFVRRKTRSVPRLDERGEQPDQHRCADGGLEGEARHPARARVARARGRRGRARAVVRADRLTQRVVARGPAEALDQIVLVERRDALRRQLPAEPVGLLGEADPPPSAGGGERRGDAARAAADDQDLALDLVRLDRVRHPNDRDRRIAARRNPSDVDDLVERALVPALSHALSHRGAPRRGSEPRCRGARRSCGPCSSRAPPSRRPAGESPPGRAGLRRPMRG